MSKTNPKLIARKDIASLCDKLRKKRIQIVFTNGVFDILHMGHVSYLRKAKAMGDVLVIGLNSDASVRRIKGSKRPINKQTDRAGVMGALEMVDYIVPFSEDTPAKLIELVQPHVLVKGADYKISEIVGSEFVKSYGGKVKRIAMLSGRSTTKIISKHKK